MHTYNDPLLLACGSSQTNDRHNVIDNAHLVLNIIVGNCNGTAGAFSILKYFTNICKHQDIINNFVSSDYIIYRC